MTQELAGGRRDLRDVEARFRITHDSTRHGELQSMSALTCTSRDRTETRVGCVEPEDLINNPVHPLN